MRPIYLKDTNQQWAHMAKIENLRGCVDRLKEIQKENRQTQQGNTIHKLTSGTTRKACHKYANKNEKGSSPSKRFKASPVRIQTVADTTKYNHNGLAVYNTGRDHFLKYVSQYQNSSKPVQSTK